METTTALIMTLNIIYHVAVGACLIPKLKSRSHVLYLAISTFAYSVFGIFAYYNNISILADDPYILYSINLLFVLIMLIVNIVYYVKAMKNKFTHILNVVHVCLMTRGTKEERRKLQDEYFDKL